jgi:hypothetical protein
MPVRKMEETKTEQYKWHKKLAEGKLMQQRKI